MTAFERELLLSQLVHTIASKCRGYTYVYELKLSNGINGINGISINVLRHVGRNRKWKVQNGGLLTLTIHISWFSDKINYEIPKAIFLGYVPDTDRPGTGSGCVIAYISACRQYLFSEKPLKWCYFTYRPSYRGKIAVA